jgi:NAD(P)-dependent dehydrogenase (short-subunit alcohol dehydrogenase family)
MDALPSVGTGVARPSDASAKSRLRLPLQCSSNFGIHDLFPSSTTWEILMTDKSKTAVVTGASSGIGRATVARLTRAGWHVFATVRKADDGAQLQQDFGTAVTPLLMDVADRATITHAADQVRAELGDRGLDALVNVAGIGLMRPVEFVTDGDMRHIFEVNVFGQVAVTQALLPLLRRARGRIVNIGSVGAHIGLPFGGLLNASKSALRSLNDALRLELRSSGVRVVIVEPGAIKTPAVNKTLGDVEGVIRDLPPRGAEEYGDMLRTFAKRGYALESNGSDPDVVAKVVQQALTEARPRPRYAAGKHANVLALVGILVPAIILDVLLLKALGLPTKPKPERRGVEDLPAQGFSRGERGERFASPPL